MIKKKMMKVVNFINCDRRYMKYL